MSGARAVADLPEADYHADPALSSSGARRLLSPSCPALYHHERVHGRPPKKEFDFGHAAHHLVLGIGAPLAVVDADSWRTKAAQEARAEAYAAGATPLLAGQHAIVCEMADALQRHPVARRLFDTDAGVPETSVFWRDDEYGVDCRARFDWLTTLGDGVDCQQLIVDYKTTTNAHPDAIARACADHGYHQQEAWYVDAAIELGLPQPAFVFVFQEKTAPYLVTPIQIHPDAVAAGRARNAEAMAVFRSCTDSGEWPSYTSGDIQLVDLPAWAY